MGVSDLLEHYFDQHICLKPCSVAPPIVGWACTLIPDCVGAGACVIGVWCECERVMCSVMCVMCVKCVCDNYVPN